MFWKYKKCFICGARDEKANMECGVYGIYGDKKRYFHVKCVETVICDPEEYTTRAVDKALWCHENKIKRLKEDETAKKIKNLRITNAQESIECIK